MHLPDFPFKKIIYSIALSVGLIVSFFAGTQFQKNKSAQQAEILISDQRQLCDETINRKEDEINRCYQDRVNIVSNSFGESYSFEEFGVFSPLLENGTIDTTIYDYKRTKVAWKILTPASNQTWKVAVWEVIGQGPAIKNDLLGSNINFPIFGGYENHGNEAIYISEKILDWDEDISFTNNFDIEFHFTYHYQPKHIGLVSTDFYSSYSVSGNPIFVEVLYPVENYLEAVDKSHPSVATARQNAREIAETVSLRLENNP